MSGSNLHKVQSKSHASSSSHFSLFLSIPISLLEFIFPPTLQECSLPLLLPGACCLQTIFPNIDKMMCLNWKSDYPTSLSPRQKPTNCLIVHRIKAKLLSNINSPLSIFCLNIISSWPSVLPYAPTIIDEGHFPCGRFYYFLKYSVPLLIRHLFVVH